MCIITFYYTILVTRLARASFLSATFYFTDGEPLKLPESLELFAQIFKVENMLKGSLD